MYVIMTYDVGQERISKVLSIGRKYLTWIQNSVFEGEISDANFMRLKHELSRVIDEKHDSITFFILRTTAYVRKETLGITKGESMTII